MRITSKNPIKTKFLIKSLQQRISWLSIFVIIQIRNFTYDNILHSGSLSVIGTIYGVVGSLMLSLYSIYTKKVLPHINQEVWLLSYYNNAYSMFLLMPLIVMNGELHALWNFTSFGSPFFWTQMVIGGICGFAIGYFTSLQIKVLTYYII